MEFLALSLGARGILSAKGRVLVKFAGANRSAFLEGPKFMALLYKHRTQFLLLFLLLRVEYYDWNEYQLLVFHGVSKKVEIKSHEAHGVQVISFEAGNKEVRS